MCSVLKQMTHNFIGVANLIEPNSNHVEHLIFSGGIARRLDAVRKGIMEHYPRAEVVLASNETFVGLHEYEKIVSRDN